MNLSYILAQAAQKAQESGANGNGGEQAPQAPGSGLLTGIGYIVILLLIFWFILFRPKAKEQKERQKMLENINKHDRIVTIGGIIGTVMEIKEDEITLKVDDNTNTRMKFSRGAVQKVVSSAQDKSKEDQQDQQEQK
jgi:preprotein translocase subunit YajC